MNEVESSIRYSVTFRLDGSTLKKLRFIAKNEQVSLNTLANQIFRNHVEWDSTATKAGWATFHKIAVGKLIDNLDDDSLVRSATQTADIVRDITMLMAQSHDSEGYLNMLKNSAKKSGFVLVEPHNDSSPKIIFRHDMGRKWSVFFKAYYEKMLQNLGYPAKFGITENTLVMDFQNP